MHANRVDSLLVVDGAGILKGYIDIEMVDSNYKKKSYVHEAMDTAKYAVDKNSLLRDTMHRMLRRGSSYVPVVTDNNKLAGIVTRATLADMVFNTIWGDETEDITAIE